MKQKLLYALWGCLFILCAGLGFIPEPEGNARILLTLIALLFFLPPALLLYRGDPVTAKLLRNLAALSLGATMVLLVLNFLTVFSSEKTGQVLNYVLIMVSSPMVCSGHWALSLFLWACLLMASLKQSRR